jgi:HPt (histidine-containing phosphotransfer) domain-containing protein
LKELIARAEQYGRAHLPPEAANDPELQRRGLTTLMFAAVMFTQAPFFATVSQLIGARRSALFILLSGAFLLLVPTLMRRSVALGLHSPLCMLWCLLVSVSFETDGPRSAPAFWFAVLPVMATLTTDGLSPLFWLAMSAAAPVGLWLFELGGGHFGSVAAGVPRDTLFVLSMVMLTCVMYALAYVYASARRVQVRTVEAMNHDMRLVLDNVEQGFVVVGPDGTIMGQRSAITERWLGPLAQGARFSDWVGRSDRAAGEALELGLEQLFEGFFPVNLALDQLPRHCSASERTLDLHYRPIGSEDAPVALVIIVTDATERIQAEQAEAAQRELTAVVSHWARDRQGLLHFLTEAEQIVEELATGTPSALRLVHTLKGNAALFGLRDVASVCHEVETEAKDAQRPPSPDELARIRQAWGEASKRIAPLFSRESGDDLAIPKRDLTDILDALDSDAPRESVRRMLVKLHHEPAERVFTRFAEQAAALARRLGKADVVPVYEPNGARFDPVRWGPVWSAMVHAVRNAVDHGGEPADERLARGKPCTLTLRFSCWEDGSGLRVEMSDDGAGVDWERVREKAMARGLPHATQAELEAALFMDGLSTRDEASEVSGRGVGLGALREACVALGGDVHVRSVRGQGTTLTIHVPYGAADAQRAA